MVREFLSLDYVVEESESEVKIEAEGKELVLPDSFFAQAEDRWLSIESLPSQPLHQWDSRDLGCDINLVSPLVPIIYGDNKESLYKIDKGRLKPSKSLQSSLKKMLKGSQEFKLIDGQKLVYENAKLMALKSYKDQMNKILNLTSLLKNMKILFLMI